MDGRPSPQLRLLAPIALAVFALAFLLVVFGGGDESATESGSEGAESTEQSADGEQPRPANASASYTVKEGDTLGDISERTGLGIDRLLELNPALDPQSLAPGQTIKLRE